MVPNENVLVKMLEAIFVEYMTTTTYLNREEARHVFYACKIDDAVKGVDILHSKRMF